MGMIAKNNKFYSGPRGKSAYEIAVKNGFEGTEQEWLDSLKFVPDNLDELIHIIDDAVVSIDKTWSSSHTQSKLNEGLNTAKAYTLSEIGKAIGASYKVVNATADMNETKYIYLLPNGDTYDLYIFEEDTGSVTKIGNTTIDLSDYYTKSESDDKYATKTELTSVSDAVSNVADDVNDVKEALDDYLPLSGGIIDGAISFQSVDNGYCGITKHHDETSDYGMLLQDTSKDGRLVAIKLAANVGNAVFIATDGTESVTGELIHAGNIEVYTGSNVPKTVIEFSNTTNWSIPNTNLETFYMVRNGWCFLHVVAHCNKVANDNNSVVYGGLPIPPFQVYGKFVGEDNTYEPCNLTIATNGQMLLRGGTAGKDYSFTYTYPVV